MRQPRSSSSLLRAPRPANPSPHPYSVRPYTPTRTQGLSHFLEHMLFMGSAKYPRENAYDAYLTSHGGGGNAYTELEHTNYHFDVNPGALRGALDRFAQARARAALGFLFGAGSGGRVWFGEGWRSAGCSLPLPSSRTRRMPPLFGTAL